MLLKGKAMMGRIVILFLAIISTAEINLCLNTFKEKISNNNLFRKSSSQSKRAVRAQHLPADEELHDRMEYQLPEYETWRLTPEGKLFLAIVHGDEAQGISLIKQGINVNARDSWGSTPLHIAASYGNYAIAKLLLDKGALVDAPDNEGYTPLHRAVRADEEDIVRLLLDAGAQINAQTHDEQTPLHMATNGKVVKLLLDKGASITVQDDVGHTPLHHAIMHDDSDVARPLLEAGARVDVQDKSGATPLDMVIDYGDELSDLLTSYAQKQGVALPPTSLSIINSILEKRRKHKRWHI
jgi:ankyrin repeat protein